MFWVFLLCPVFHEFQEMAWWVRGSQINALPKRLRRTLISHLSCWHWCKDILQYKLAHIRDLGSDMFCSRTEQATTEVVNIHWSVMWGRPLLQMTCKVKSKTAASLQISSAEKQWERKMLSWVKKKKEKCLSALFALSQYLAFKKSLYGRFPDHF